MPMDKILDTTAKGVGVLFTAGMAGTILKATQQMVPKQKKTKNKRLW